LSRNQKSEGQKPEKARVAFLASRFWLLSDEVRPGRKRGEGGGFPPMRPWFRPLISKTDDKTWRHRRTKSLNFLFSVLCLLSSDSRKEVIQPQVPLRLPCYDFTPVADPTVVACLLAVSETPSGKTNSHGVTGGVYKARERIHRGVLIRDY
jgi:hypothetical protein